MPVLTICYINIMKRIGQEKIHEIIISPKSIFIKKEKKEEEERNKEKEKRKNGREEEKKIQIIK